jgi:hypothetical protein
VDSLNDVVDFLTTVTKHGFINDNTAGARKTAIAKLSEVLEDDQRTCEYVLSNIDTIKVRMQNLAKDVRGGTIDAYASRALFAINEYQKWKSDRSAWERDSASRNRAPAENGEKKPKMFRPTMGSKASGPHTMQIRLQSGFEVSVTLPNGEFTQADVARIAYFLRGVATDFDPFTNGRPATLIEQQ